MHSVELEPGIFINSDFSVYYEDYKTVFIADLHLGYETSMVEDGISLPPIQREKIMDRVSAIMDKYGPEEIVVVGDFKHSFGKRYEMDMYGIMDYILERTNLSFVRGNHDNFLRTLISSRSLRMEEEKRCVGEVTAAHGHLGVEFDGILVQGHEHPALRIRDDSGGVVSLHCFLYHPEKRIIVLPAFNPLTHGRNILTADGFLSETLREISPDEFVVYPITETGLMNFHRLTDVKAAMPDLI